MHVIKTVLQRDVTAIAKSRRSVRVCAFAELNLFDVVAYSWNIIKLDRLDGNKVGSLSQI